MHGATDAIDVHLSHDNKISPLLGDTKANGQEGPECKKDNSQKSDQKGVQPSLEKPLQKPDQSQHSQKSGMEQSAEGGANQQVDAKLAMLDNQLRHILKPGREESTGSAEKQRETLEEPRPVKQISRPSDTAIEGSVPGATETGEAQPNHLPNGDIQLNGAQSDSGHITEKAKSDHADEKPLDQDADENEHNANRQTNDNRKPIRIEDDETGEHKDGDGPRISMPGNEDDGKDEAARKPAPLVDLTSRLHNGSVMFGTVEERSITNFGPTSVYVDENATRMAPYTLASQFNVSLGSDEENSAADADNHSGKWELVPRPHTAGHSPGASEKRRSLHGLPNLMDEERMASSMTEDQFLASLATMGRTDELHSSVVAAAVAITKPDGDPEDEEEANGVTEKVEDAHSDREDYIKVLGKRTSLPHDTHFAKQDLLSQSFSGLPRSGSQHFELSALDGSCMRDRLVVVQSHSMDSIGVDNSPRIRLQGILKRADSEHCGLSGEQGRSHSPSANLDHLSSSKQVDFNHSKLNKEQLQSDMRLEERGAADGESPRLFLDAERREEEEENPTTPVAPGNKITQELELVAETLIRTRDSPPTAVPAEVLRLTLEAEDDHQSSSESHPDIHPLHPDVLDGPQACSPRDPLLRASIDVAALPDTRSASPESSRTPRPPASPAPRKAVVATAAR